MDINRGEVLRYLGYKNQQIDDELNNLIDSCIEEIKDISKPLYTYRVFDVKAQDNRANVLGTGLVLDGRDIYNHLKYSKKCAILASTLGVGVDNRIRYLSKTNMTRSFILDACATEAIESICNEVEEEIRQEALKEGLYINFRYSPGYGDLSIDVQRDILGVLNTGARIGLTCTESSILLPRKSVTAIVGFNETNEEKVKKGCSSCRAFETCLYKRDGISCGI